MELNKATPKSPATDRDQVSLNPNSSEPLFLQIQNDIASKVESGAYDAGKKLPNELQLAEQYGVGRITVRRAISELSRDGVLVKKQGKGTFVRERRIFRKIEHTMSFTESCRMNGLEESNVVMVHEVLPPESRLIPTPQCFNGESVLHIQRLRLASETPVTIEDNFYSLSRLGFLLTEDLESSSLFRVLAEHGVDTSKFRNSYIEATKATTAQAAMLSVPVGDPLFLLHEEALDENGETLFVGNQYIAGSRYRFLYDNIG